LELGLKVTWQYKTKNQIITKNKTLHASWPIWFKVVV
jgi:hypothetical protein